MTEQDADFQADETGDKPVATPSAQQESKQRTPTKAVATGRTGRKPWLLWLLVLVIGVALGAFYWQQSRLSQQQGAALQQVQDNYQRLQQSFAETTEGMESELQSQVSLLEDSASALDSAMSELRQLEQQDARELLALQQGFERQLQDTQVLIVALQRQLAALQQRDTRWLNAEVAYLMRLASHKLSVEQDVATAVQLLQSIEALLADQFDPAARTALISVVSDRTSLQSISVPDKLTLSAQVDALLQKLNEISITAVQELIYQQGIRDARQQTSEIAQEQGWSAALMNLLRSIFVWRQTDFGSLAFVPLDQETLIKQQIALLFEQARIAILRSDQAQFDLMLQQAAAGVERHFAQDSELARELLADVERLRAQPVAPVLPDLSGTMALIDQLATSSADASPVPDSTEAAETAL